MGPLFIVIKLEYVNRFLLMVCMLLINKFGYILLNSINLTQICEVLEKET